jgi:hypothetical protein
MSLFIEVDSVEKNCKVIINLDSILEIAPLRGGGCDLFITDSASVGGKVSMKVKDSYSLFKQFAMQTVSPDDIANRIVKLPIAELEPHPRFVSDNENPPEVKRGPGRPKVMMTTTENLG